MSSHPCFFAPTKLISACDVVGFILPSRKWLWQAENQHMNTRKTLVISATRNHVVDAHSFFIR